MIILTYLHRRQISFLQLTGLNDLCVCVYIYFQCNRIHHGKRSGIVVLGSGRGQVRHNDIYQNKEAGVYILFRGNPTVW